MLVFPNAKINLGLNVTEKRTDGFHNIETVFYPVGWSDCLEVLSSEFSVQSSQFLVQGDKVSKAEPILTSSGLHIGGELVDNLLYKAWQLISEKYKLPPVKIHLHKVIPMGAGLGGGSSDAAFFINLMNEKFSLNMPLEERLSIAGKLGSDCAFFIENKAVYAKGKGDEFEPLAIDLNRYKILIVYPGIHSNTKDAYSGIVPAKPKHRVKDVVCNYTPEEWKDLLVNDFEKSIFLKHPRMAEIKKMLYDEGALYASMSGSGSAVFGLFENLPQLKLRTGEVMWND